MVTFRRGSGLGRFCCCRGRERHGVTEARCGGRWGSPLAALVPCAELSDSPETKGTLGGCR